MAKFGLEPHPDKTRLIEFGRFAARNRASRGLGNGSANGQLFRNERCVAICDDVF